MIAAWMLGTTLPAAAALQFATPTFVASGEVLLPAAMAAADEKTNSIAAPDAFINGQVKLLKSDRILQTVIDRLGLWHDAEIASTKASFGAAWGRSGIVAGGDDGYRAARVAQLRDRLSVTALAPAPAIRVSYVSADPYKAAAVSNGLVQAYIDTYKAEFRQEDRQAENNLAQRLTTLQERAAAAAQAASEPAEQDSRRDGKRQQLEAILNVYRSLYETTLTQYSELARGAKPATSEPRIVSAAIATRGDGALRLGILGLALAAGALAGLALAVRREAARPVRSMNDISANLGVPALGFVSLVPGRKLFPKRTRATPLLLHDDKDHLRALLLRIRRGANGAGPVLLGVASALQGEGKSTVAFNLAVLAVEGGARVLLIDMDLHNSTLSKTLTEDGQTRLVDAIRGGCDLQDGVVATEHGFDFLGERALDDDVRPVTVLVPHAMEALLARARTLYDIVICDLPPVLDHADMGAMADALDYFVFIAEWGRTPAHALERALQCSPLVESRILGTLLNKVPSQC